MKAVIFFRDPDARMVAKRFCVDVKAYLGEEALPVSLMRSGDKLFCGVEDRNDNPSPQTFPLQADDPGQPTFDAFLRGQQGAMDPGCHVIACWVWAEGRTLKDFVEDIAHLCVQSQFIDDPRRRLVLYIVAPSSKVPKEWKDCLEIVQEIYRSPALRSVVLVTDHTRSGTLMWPDEPLDQLRLWLWGSLISYGTSAHGDARRDTLDDLKYDFWPTNDTDGDYRDTHFSSIGAIAKSLYNRERLQRLWQSQVFRELENSINLESKQVGNQSPSKTVEDIVKSATAGMEDKVSSDTFSSPEFTSRLPWPMEKMRASLKAWQSRAKLELEQAGKKSREALTKKDGISEILRQEVRSRVEKYLKDLETHEKQLFDAPLGESLWVRLPAYLKDIDAQRENLDKMLKPAWGEWKHLDDVSIQNAAAIIEPAVETAQQKLEELTVGRLVKWLSLCLIIPAAVGGVFMALNSFFPLTVPLKSWTIGIGLAGAGALSAGIVFWLWNRKRAVILSKLKDDVQKAFNALHARYQKVIGQLLLFYNNKLFQVAKGILDDRLLQWGGFQERIGVIQDPLAQDKADPLLRPDQKKNIIKSLENCWKSFLLGLSPEKPLIPLWESEVEKPLREEIIKVLDGLTVDPETIWEKMDAMDWPLPLANYHSPGGIKYIMLVPKGFDAIPPETMDTKNALIVQGSPPHTLVKMAYRSGSHEEIILKD